MALFKLPLAFALAATRLSKRLIIIFICIALLIELPVAPAFAYDNSIAPPFKADLNGRGYNGVSIHPDGAQWLVSECTDRLEPPTLSCYLFLYNRKTLSYQRYPLPAGFAYTDAQLSPTGQWVVGVRTRVSSKESSREERVRTFLENEIFLLRTDGTQFRTLPTPKGQVKYPTISPDETKIAYWVSGRVRGPGQKTTFMDFDIHEMDLASKKDSLFAGPYKFFLAQGLKYKSNSEIVADAYAPTAFISSMREYRDKYGSSNIYVFRRGTREFPKPEFSSISSANSPTFSNDKRTFMLGSPESHGLSIVEANDKGRVRHWRIPMVGPQGIVSITASPDGTYIAFVYPVTPISSSHPKNNLGIFDLLEERWIPVSLPSPESASLLRIQS